MNINKDLNRCVTWFFFSLLVFQMIVVVNPVVRGIGTITISSFGGESTVYSTSNTTVNYTYNFGGDAFISWLSGTDTFEYIFGGDASVHYYDYGNWSDWWVFTVVPPAPPTGFVASTYSSSQINLSWTMGEGADTTHIRYKKGSYPVTHDDGTLLFNMSGLFSFVCIDIRENQIN